MEIYDLIVIGGGAAGIMAALSAAELGGGGASAGQIVGENIEKVKLNGNRNRKGNGNERKKILLVERSFALGRKILISGAGRCNLTNRNLEGNKWISHYYTDTPQILSNVFGKYGYQEIVGFFRGLGIFIYEEQKNRLGKIFPITDSAKNVVTILEQELATQGVEVVLNTECAHIEKKEQLFELNLAEVVFDRFNPKAEQSFGKSRLVFAKNVVLAAGGKTYPALGANGSGYVLAGDLGHSIIEPVPAAGPLLCSDPLVKELQGVKISVKARLLIDGQEVKSGQDDILFAEYGISGSLVFNFSRPVSIIYNRQLGQRVQNQIDLKVNFISELDRSGLENEIKTIKQKHGKRLVSTMLLGLVPAKVATAIMKVLGIDLESRVGELDAKLQEKLIAALFETTFKISGTRGWNDAEFSAGGVMAAEVNPETLESQIVPGLFLCGEIINVDGDVGGYNLSWAWASGAIAGKLGRF